MSRQKGEYDWVFLTVVATGIAIVAGILVVVFVGEAEGREKCKAAGGVPTSVRGGFLCLSPGSIVEVKP